METLAEYVSRIIKEKKLKVAEIEKRSGVADSYITNITRGTSKNPTIEKLKALAKGLDVDEDEIFRVARGVPPKDELTVQTLAGIFNRLLDKSDFSKLVIILSRQKPTKIKAILKSLESEQ
jgi:transcriptional regulator with XRE-family HTH domain